MTLSQRDEKLSQQKDVNVSGGEWYSVLQLLKSQTALALWGCRLCSSESSWPFTLSQSEPRFLPHRLISKSNNKPEFVLHSSNMTAANVFLKAISAFTLWQLYDLQTTNKTTIINFELGDKRSHFNKQTLTNTHKYMQTAHTQWQVQRNSFKMFRWKKMQLRTYHFKH